MAINSFSPTWETINEQLSIFLADEDDPPTYADIQRIDAWNWSQRFLASSHTPRGERVDITINSDGRSAELPDDFIRVWKIYIPDDTRWMWPMETPQPGWVRSESDEANYFWVWGRTLMLERTVSTNELEVFYWAYWPEVEYKQDNDELILVADRISVPPWSILPLCHLTAATVLQPGSISAARLRNFNMKIDSGNPIQNSRAEQAREHWSWWMRMISAVPPMDESWGNGA